MDADAGGSDGFEFNLTKVLESLERGPTSLEDLEALGSEPEPLKITPVSDDLEPLTIAPISDDPAPLTITPVSDDDEPVAPLPHRVPSQRTGGQQTRPAPRPARVIPPGTPATTTAAPEPLPTRTPPVTSAPEPLPTRTAAAPKPDLVPPGRRSMFDEAASGEARAALHRVPADTNLAAAALDTPTLAAPTLPAPTPAPAPAAPPVPGQAPAANTVMPSIADVRQFQSAQRRRARKNRQGRVMGRLLLVVVLIVGAVAVALTVGREYLFPASWADDLAPLAEQIEAERGVEFEEVVELVEQPTAEYADTVARAVLGADPASRVAVWRALGVASGEPDVVALGVQLAQIHPAVYDPQAGTIVRQAGVRADLRPALEAALDAQLAEAEAESIGVLGPVPAERLGAASPDVSDGGPLTPPVGAVDAAEQVVADLAVTDAPLADVPPADGPPFGALPIDYQEAAAARLTPALGGRPPALPATTLAPEATLAAGDVPVAGPVALSLDDWALVWANRLPAESVATLTAATTANSVRTFDRAGTLCVGAMFEAGNELFAAALVNDLGRWAAAAPAEAQAMVTQVAPTYVQLTACDPGAVPQALDAGAVDVVVTQQLARLATPDSSEN